MNVLENTIEAKKKVTRARDFESNTSLLQHDCGTMSEILKGLAARGGVDIANIKFVIPCFQSLQ
jgi:hypothetical protein